MRAADHAYMHLVALVGALGGGEPEVVTFWAACHGIADLTTGGKLRTVACRPEAERAAMIRATLERALPSGTAPALPDALA